MAKQEPGKYVTEHIFELRHEASGSFLDLRGRIADHIKNNGYSKHWAIQENAISFFNADGSINRPNAIISFNNIAVITRDPPTMNYFQDQSLAFLKIVGDFKGYDVPKLQRFGVRTKCYIPTKKLDFNGVYKSICDKLFHFEELNKIGNAPVDLQLVLDFKEAPYDGRIILGPVKEDEAKRYFSFFSKEFCAPGVYIDVDYFQNGDLRLEEIKKLLTRVMDLTWKRINNTASTLDV